MPSSITTTVYPDLLLSNAPKRPYPITLLGENCFPQYKPSYREHICSHAYGHPTPLSVTVPALYETRIKTTEASGLFMEGSSMLSSRIITSYPSAPPCRLYAHVGE
jgi:hypothetical protein